MTTTANNATTTTTTTATLFHVAKLYDRKGRQTLPQWPPATPEGGGLLIAPNIGFFGPCNTSWERAEQGGEFVTPETHSIVWLADEQPDGPRWSNLRAVAVPKDSAVEWHREMAAEHMALTDSDAVEKAAFEAAFALVRDHCEMIRRPKGLEEKGESFFAVLDGRKIAIVATRPVCVADMSEKGQVFGLVQHQMTERIHALVKSSDI